MRTYDQLSESEQAIANERALDELVAAIVEGGIHFDDAKNGDNLQAAMDAAMERAENMRTPWFAGEYIMDARYNPGEGHVVESDGLWPVAEALRGIASCDAEDALYPEQGERVIWL